MKITVETVVAAPPEILFATVADFAHWTSFVRAIERVDIISDGADRVGTRFRETRIMFGRSATEEMTVTVLEPPRRMQLSAENHGTRYLATHEIVPEAGGARLVLAFEGVPVSVAARLFSFLARLFAGALRKQLLSDLADVKAEAERRARS